MKICKDGPEIIVESFDFSRNSGKEGRHLGWI